MKLGLIIATVIILFFGGLFFFMVNHKKAVTIRETSPKLLQSIVISDDMPAAYMPSNFNQNASDLYLKAIRLYVRHADDFAMEEPPASLVEDLCSVLTQATKAANTTPYFLDNQIPFKPAADPEFGDALEGITNVVTLKAQTLFDQNKQAEIIELSRGLFAMGHRLFINTQRLYLRRMGLEMMTTGLGWLETYATEIKNGQEITARWQALFSKIQAQWNVKLGIVRALKPHVGDLLNIAKHDQDMAFRIAAILQLGIVKFSPGHSGNKAAIEETLKTYRHSNEALLSQAAQAAEDFTVDDLHLIH